MSMIRWAKPHKGPPHHLTNFEYRLRWWVFGSLYVLVLVPLALIGSVLALAGPIAIIMVLLNLPRMVAEFHLWDQEVKVFAFSLLMTIAVLTPTALWLRFRYLEPR